MIPENTLSSQPVFCEFMTPARNDQLIDYEMGGDELNKPSASYSELWKCFYENGHIKISDNENIHILLKIADVVALTFAFDLNMRPIVAYSTKSSSFLNWYDTSAGAQVTTELGKDFSFLQLSLDDNRSSQSASADVIFAYIRNHKLYMRIQRERFQIEHELTQAKRLIQIGMMKNNRFGFAYYDWN